MAIAQANSSPGPDSIVLPAWTYPLLAGGGGDLQPRESDDPGRGQADTGSRVVDAQGKSRRVQRGLRLQGRLRGPDDQERTAGEGADREFRDGRDQQLCPLLSIRPRTGGGGLYNQGTATATNSWFAYDTAAQGAGVWTNEFVFTAKNYASSADDTATTYGGGLFNDYGYLRVNGAVATVTGGSFVLDSAGSGGGVFGWGNTTLANVNFSLDTAQKGGAVAGYLRDDDHRRLDEQRHGKLPGGHDLEQCDGASPMSVNGVDIEYNLAWYGGGVYDDSGGSITLASCTISNKTAAAGGRRDLQRGQRRGGATAACSSSTRRWPAEGSRTTGPASSGSTGPTSSTTGRSRAAAGASSTRAAASLSVSDQSLIGGNSAATYGGGILDAGGSILLFQDNPPDLNSRE